MRGLDSTQEPIASFEGLEIAVIIPCHNEGLSIGKVIEEFHQALPMANVYVYDNNSSDDTREVASKAGAIVREEELQGKGNVVRRMFSDIEADYYIMIDGDDTYDVYASTELLKCAIDKNLDMVNGARVSSDSDAYRPGHRLGNRMLTSIVAMVFGDRINDMLSGFRVFSRRFVKSFPALSGGFEIETELTIHALELKLPIAEVETTYKGRLEGSESKLRTYRDGLMILKMIATLVKEERPLQFFLMVAAVLSLLSVVLAWPVVIEFIETGLVPRFPTAILSSAIMLLAFLSLFTGMVLDTVTHGRREMKRMWYLSVPNRKKKQVER
jgi:glycosyltransferase involved in cell wall biosynthesis